MFLVFPFYVLITSGYLVVTGGYFQVASATTGYFSLLLEIPGSVF